MEKNKERNLEEQIRMYSNTKVISLGYIQDTQLLPYSSVYFFIITIKWWMVLTISILMLMAILTDYFLFHYVSDRIKELTRVNKELAELKEEHKE